MKKITTFLLCTFVFVQVNSFAWGETGHRVVGEIAWMHLNKKAKKNVARILGNESLAMCSTWMDFVRSNPAYDKYAPWHYCTLGEHTTYDSTMLPPEGDVVYAINKMTKELITGNFSVDEAFALKCLTHMVGDIHQPLHCGNGKDKGGNTVKVSFFYSNSNLHRVWDSGIINRQNLSYTEYTNWINTATKDQISKWQNSTVEQWAAESKELHPQVYDFNPDGKLSYRYIYKNIDTLNMRLLQAGIRLAAVLNNIYS